jgi:methionine salvage enolase-phosphatase E1
VHRAKDLLTEGEAKNAARDLHLHDNAEELKCAAKASEETEKSNKDGTAPAIRSPTPKSLK